MALLTMTILSTALAATMSVTAWRLVRREARRSEARVAALSSAIFGPEGPVSADIPAAIASFPSEYAAAAPTVRPASNLSRRLVARVSVAAVVVAGLMILAATRRGGHALRDGGSVSPMSAATAPSARRFAQTLAAAPLELLALGHERAGDTLIVRGTIRNPSNGTAGEVPAVVVLTFDKHGIFLGSSESNASGESLPPGGRATFSVSVPAGAATPARYKVSFRSAGRVVPHVDRRLPDAGAGGIDSAPVAQPAGPVLPVPS